MDTEFVLDPADLDPVLAIADEHAQTPAVLGPGLGTGEHQEDLGIAVGDEALDALQPPLAGLVLIGCHIDGLQVGPGIRLGECHGTGRLAARELRQEFLALLLGAVFVDGLGDVLETEEIHERGLGPRHHLDRHRIDGGRQVEPAIAARQGEAHQLGLGQCLQGRLGPLGIAHLTGGKVAPLLVDRGGLGGHDVGGDVADDLQHLPIVVDGVLVVGRGEVERFGLAVAVLGDLDHLLELQAVELEQQIGVVGEKVGHGSTTSTCACRRG